MVGRPPRYNAPTAPVATRLPEEVRRILDWLVLTTDAESVADYIRRLIESHLLDLGFTLEPGVHLPMPRPPARDQIVEWEVTGGRQPR